MVPPLHDWGTTWECDRKATRKVTRLRDKKEFKMCGYCARRFDSNMMSKYIIEKLNQ